MQEKSRKDIGYILGLDQKRNGTELTRTNRIENGIVSLRTRCSTSVKMDIQYFLDPVLWNEELYEGKEKENCLYNSVVTTTQSGLVLRNHLHQSAQYLRQDLWLFRKYRETCSSEQFRVHGDANSIVDNEQNAADQ